MNAMEIQLADHIRATIAPALAAVDVPHLVIGGLATGAYLPGRATRDIDILIAASDVTRAMAALERAGARLCGPLIATIGGGTIWVLLDGTEIDLIVSGSPWVARALATPRAWDRMALIDLPYLVVAKMLPGRPRDEDDIAGMLAHADGDALAAVRRVVATELPERVDDVDAYLFIGLAGRAVEPVFVH